MRITSFNNRMCIFYLNIHLLKTLFRIFIYPFYKIDFLFVKKENNLYKKIKHSKLLLRMIYYAYSFLCIVLFLFSAFLILLLYLPFDYNHGYSSILVLTYPPLRVILSKLTLPLIHFSI